MADMRDDHDALLSKHEVKIRVLEKQVKELEHYINEIRAQTNLPQIQMVKPPL